MKSATHSAFGPDHLVDLVLAAGVANSRVLEAFRRVPRDGFVPSQYRLLAYEDAPVGIGHQLVGTGLGLQTALLAYLCRDVYSVEWYPDLAEQARRNLGAAGIRNAT